MFSKDSKHFFKFLNHIFIISNKNTRVTKIIFLNVECICFFEEIIGNKVKHTIYISHKKTLVC